MRMAFGTPFTTPGITEPTDRCRGFEIATARVGRSVSIVAMAVTIARFSANKVRRIVDAARPDIPCHLRVGTDGTRAGHHAGCNP